MEDTDGKIHGYAEPITDVCDCRAVSVVERLAPVRPVRQRGHVRQQGPMPVRWSDPVIGFRWCSLRSPPGAARCNRCNISLYKRDICTNCTSCSIGFCSAAISVFAPVHKSLFLSCFHHVHAVRGLHLLFAATSFMFAFVREPPWASITAMKATGSKSDLRPVLYLPARFSVSGSGDSHCSRQMPPCCEWRTKIASVAQPAVTRRYALLHWNVGTSPSRNRSA